MRFINNNPLDRQQGIIGQSAQLEQAIKIVVDELLMINYIN